MATQAGRKATRASAEPPDFDFTRSPIHLLRRAQQRALEIFNREVGASGLTPRQFIVLLAVQENEGLTQTDLVNRTRIDRSTLADMISRLIKRDLLSRRRTEQDQRANAVTITAAGRRALKAALARVRKAEDKLLEQLPENRRNMFLDSLGALADTMEQEGEAPRASKEAKPNGRAKPAAAKPARGAAAKARAGATTEARAASASPGRGRPKAAASRTRSAGARQARANPPAAEATEAMAAQGAAAEMPGAGASPASRGRAAKAGRKAAAASAAQSNARKSEAAAKPAAKPGRKPKSAATVKKGRK